MRVVLPLYALAALAVPAAAYATRSILFVGNSFTFGARLGRGESAARELSIPPALAARLQRIAYDIAIGGRCRT
ncbi:MAG: hypothetical protein ABIW33_04550 [Sphingomicrobium sp.]